MSNKKCNMVMLFSVMHMIHCNMVPPLVTPLCFKEQLQLSGTTTVQKAFM